eukprot:3180112-Lingulodinium_polyedra.AAC.1
MPPSRSACPPPLPARRSCQPAGLPIRWSTVRPVRRLPTCRSAGLPVSWSASRPPSAVCLSKCRP